MNYLSQKISNPALGSFGNQTGAEFLSNLLPALISGFFVVGVTVFLFMLLLGGIQWISSGGDKGKAEMAKQTLTNAGIGVFILLSFFAILTFVECFFGIGLRQVTIGEYNISFMGSPVCK
jgi:hypothetical protein